MAHVAPVAAEEAPIAAELATTPVTLVPANERLVTTYRWPRWVPWTVVGELNDMRESSERRQRLRVAMLLGASAALVTGVVLVVLNRPEHHVLKLDLVPAPGGATASVGWRF